LLSCTKGQGLFEVVVNGTLESLVRRAEKKQASKVKGKRRDVSPKGTSGEN
jgi:hypothetical protein